MDFQYSDNRQDRMLTKDEIQFYNENGYLVIRQLFSQSTLETYRDRFMDVCSGKIGSDQVSIAKDHSLYKPGAKPQEYINKVQELLYDEVFSTYSEDPRLLNIVTQLIGGDFMAASLMFINKPPGTKPHPPHQDMIYMPFDSADKVVGAWTAIDHAHKTNGGLYVVPGSHKPQKLLVHSNKVQDAGELFYGMVNWEGVCPDSSRLILDMHPGDTLLFHPYLFHGSLQNSSKMYRNAIVCHFLSTSCQLVPVDGTVREGLARNVEKVFSGCGGDLSFHDIWRVKVKHVKGQKCKL